jgi:hypothetical protein
LALADAPRRRHIAKMAEPHPFEVIVRPCTVDPLRFRWEIRENGEPCEVSKASHAARSEAVAEGQTMMQALIIQWRRAGEGYERLMPKTPKRLRDVNQWAKRMVDIATGEVDEDPATQKQAKQKKPKQTKQVARQTSKTS